ncbi:hypothetical protein [uncultured Dialister sp.]|uniref:poly(ethylene terephthalate) hydrolase family protein n=1 Tax=uncultured Dialister sp. TaxID=278064 RepID=UPI0027DC5A0E|nr:hypothetical protein [uncultured Dialister sp.]
MISLLRRTLPLLLGAGILAFSFVPFPGAETVQAAAVPSNYETSVKTDMPLEKKYLQHGPYSTAYLEQLVDESWKKYEVWYPSELPETDQQYPVLVLSNGTGIHASSAKAMAEHFASWGFIVIGNEEDNSWAGVSAEKGLVWLLDENEREGSTFYHHIDEDHIGSYGHSQGGVGAINAASVQPHHELYKAVVSESTTQMPLARSLKWYFFPEKVKVPIFYVASNGFTDSYIVIPAKELNYLFSRSIDSPYKVMAIRKNADHGDMLYKADGYVTAWFLYWLKGDETAGTIFQDNGELAHNRLYEKVRIEKI